MAFSDLPDNAPDLPVSDPAYTADFLDLVVSERDRRRGALALLLCDDDDRMQVPVVVGDLPPELGDDERERTVARVVSAMKGRGAVLVAVARRSGLSIRAEDQAWRRAAERACAAGPRLLGVHVITLDGSREVPAQAA
jgi:hypothetical protein